MNDEKRRRARELMKLYYGGIVETESKIVPPELETVSISGSILNFNTDIVRPLNSLILHIEPHQSGSGNPSPSNIRPISGYDAVNVVRTGEVLNNSTTILNGYIDSTGVYKTSTTQSKSVYVHANAGTLYIKRTTSSVFRIGTFPSIPAHNTTATTFIDVTASTTEYSIDITSDCYVVIFIVSNSSASDVANSDAILSAFVVSDKPITTYPISLSSAGTVYGGTLDVTTGELVVDRVMKEFDGSSDETWTTLATANVFRHDALDPLVDDSRRLTGTISNECYVSSYNYTNMKANYPSISFDTTGRLYIAISDDHSTATQCKAWLAENPLQVCYYLNTPQTYQLTPTEVTTLLGENTIWMDAEGVIEAEYWRIKQ